MFRRRNLNDLFREFDLMFNQFDSVFGKTPKINKNLVYGIKNKDNNYRIEIYLYGKEPNELNYQNKNNNSHIL